MRVIGGRWKRRRLAAVPDGIRPTSDRLREALFSALGTACRGARWLDAFAGSGAVGVEALSRGARHVVFVDSRLAALRLIRTNLELCGAEPDSWSLSLRDVFRLLSDWEAPAADFLFFDPPYGFQQHLKLLSSVVESRLWSPESLIVVEHFKKTSLDPLPPPLTVSRRLKAGDSHLSFLQPAAGSQPKQPG